MARAVWAGAVLAESADTIEVDGYTYFPLDSVRWEHLKPSEHRSVCGWKGVASYWDVEVKGERNERAVWSYKDPKPAAERVSGRVGFWRGVAIER
jgi:uncharacterized protein (DUF427 family)